MDIVFFGSGQFAVKSLEALRLAKHKIALVVTQPDKPKGRHLNFLPTEIKNKARELKLDIYQPQNPNSDEALLYLKQFPADLFIVIAYGHILKNQILGLPKLFPLNIHASLLPKYKGAAPINWAIINGEKETGISIIKMNELIDAGEILLQRKITIEQGDNAQTLEEKLEVLAARSLPEALDLIEKNSVNFIKQDNKKASLAPKLEKRHGLINWNNDTVSIVNQIRGLVPWPGAFTYYKSKLIKIWSARPVQNLFPFSNCPAVLNGVKAAHDKSAAKPAEILEINKKGIIIGCANGALIITELQLESGKRLAAEAFILGHKLIVGDKLG